MLITSNSGTWNVNSSVGTKDNLFFGFLSLSGIGTATTLQWPILHGCSCPSVVGKYRRRFTSTPCFWEWISPPSCTYRAQGVPVGTVVVVTVHFRVLSRSVDLCGSCVSHTLRRVNLTCRAALIFFGFVSGVKNYVCVQGNENKKEGRVR